LEKKPQTGVARYHEQYLSAWLSQYLQPVAGKSAAARAGHGRAPHPALKPINFSL